MRAACASETETHSRSSLFLRFEDIPVHIDRASWKAAVGGKAFGLAELFQAGVPVPPGIVLQSCPQEAAQWRELFSWWASEKRPRVAVRSSAGNEDSEACSFAGQHQTFLNVASAEGLQDAVRRCFQSIHQAPAVAYRTHFDNAASAPGQPAAAMNVVIQKMVEPRVAGVYFTSDPLSPEAGWLIEWVTGLGESLVSGQRTPVRIRQDSPSTEISERLLPIIQRVERILAFPIDLEWAIDQDGSPWVLQARPITIQSSSTSKAACIARDITRLGKRNSPETCWDSHSFAEWSDVPTELSFSIWARAFSARGALGRVLRSFGYAEHGRPDGSALERVLGRPYLNLGRMDELLFGHTACVTEPLPRPHLTLRRNRVSAATLLPTAMVPFRIALAAYRLTRSKDGWIDRCRDAYSRQRELPQLPNDPSMYGDEKLPALVSKLEDRAREFADSVLVWPLTLSLLVESSTDSLRQVLAKSVPVDQVDILLQGQLRRALNASPLTTGHQYEVACADVQSLSRYMEQWGHRAAGELDLSRPRWIEVGSRALGSHPLTASAIPADAPALSQPAVDALAHIPRFYRSIYLKESAVLHDMLALREEWKHLAMRSFAHLRWMALEIGRRTGLGDLVFELTAGEVRRLATRGDGLDRLRRVAALRAERRSEFRDVHIPSIVTLDGLRSLAATASEPVEGFSTVVQGQALSPGLACGEVRVVNHPEDISARDLPENTILVTEATDPGWTPLFFRVKGVVIEKGGVLSHCAIVAREIGLPVVGGILNCCGKLNDGQIIWVDGNHGRIQLA